MDKTDRAVEDHNEFARRAAPLRERIAELEAALKPFADRVWSIDGDVGFDTSPLKTDDLWNAYCVMMKGK